MATKTNPYAAPELAAVPESGVRLAGRLLSGLLIAHVGVSAFRALLYAHGLLRWNLLPRPGAWVEAASRLSWGASLVLFGLSLLAYSIWIHGANRAARERAAGTLEFTPGLSVLASFVPVVNLVAPYRAVDEIREALGAGGVLLVRLWWGFWLAGLSWGLSFRLAAPEGALAAWRAPAHETLWAASALCLLFVVGRIESSLTDERLVDT